MQAIFDRLKDLKFGLMMGCLLDMLYAPQKLYVSYEIVICAYNFIQQYKFC